MQIQRMFWDAFDPDMDYADDQDDLDRYKEDMDEMPLDLPSEEDMVDMAQRFGDMP